MGATGGAQGVVTERDGSSYRYVTVNPQTKPALTIVERIDISDGAIDRWWYLRGSYVIPAVAYDGSAGGLSADGRTLTLVNFSRSFPPPPTKIAILDTDVYLRHPRRPGQHRPQHAIRYLNLRGHFAFQAISPNGSKLYLRHYRTRDRGSTHDRRSDDFDLWTLDSQQRRARAATTEREQQWTPAYRAADQRRDEPGRALGLRPLRRRYAPALPTRSRHRHGAGPPSGPAGTGAAARPLHAEAAPRRGGPPPRRLPPLAGIGPRHPAHGAAAVGGRRQADAPAQTGDRDGVGLPRLHHDAAPPRQPGRAKRGNRPVVGGPPDPAAPVRRSALPRPRARLRLHPRRRVRGAERRAFAGRLPRARRERLRRPEPQPGRQRRGEQAERSRRRPQPQLPLPVAADRGQPGDARILRAAAFLRAGNPPRRAPRSQAATRG